MKKRPILLSLAICLLTLSVLFTYFTMYSNVRGLDLFFNRELLLNWGQADTTPTSDAAQKTPEASTPTLTPTGTPAPTPIVTPAPTPSYVDIKLSFVGDFLMHDNVLNAHYDAEKDGYDFNPAFTQVKQVLSASDYVVASLEVPFGGKDAGKYAGYPKFNCPDALATAFAKNHIKLLFTAGTHAYDADTAGMQRTLAVLKQNGIAATGTKATAEEKSYMVADVNGVKIGFVNYMAGDRRSDGTIHTNGIKLSKEQEACMNIFTYQELDAFYTQLQGQLDEMKQAGAEVLVVGIRWGTDYKTKEDTTQKEIAQALCDMGVDIISGNGPHMIQPFTTYTSEQSGKTTLCMYSLGNFLSNQRKELISYKSGHTEDGIIYTIHIRKETNGAVSVGKVEYVPTWVSLTETTNGKLVYDILPFVEQPTESAQLASYNRTQEIVKEGVLEYNNRFFTIDDKEE